MLNKSGPGVNLKKQILAKITSKIDSTAEFYLESDQFWCNLCQKNYKIDLVKTSVEMVQFGWWAAKYNF